MKTYKELIVWQEAYKLVLVVYRLTKVFPQFEIYGLVSQLRRAVVSVPSNIAEGFNRKTKSGYLQFLYISRGSLQEVDFLLILSKDLSYLSEKDYLELKNRVDLIGRLLSGLINSIESK